MLIKSKDFSQLNLQSVATKVSATKGVPSLDYIPKQSGSIVYVTDQGIHYAYTSNGWQKLVNTDVTYTYIAHFTGSQLNDTCNTFWTDMKAANGIPSEYYISYPVVGHVFYQSGSMTSIYTSQSNTVVYQNGGNGGTTKPRTYNVWFTPQTASGWVGTASIAIQYTVHQ